MSIRTARLRAPHAVALALLCLVAFGAQARADDGTPTPPRAAPIARALPLTFASYDTLLATATAVAGDQARLYAQLQSTAAENDLAKRLLPTFVDPPVR